MDRDTYRWEMRLAAAGQLTSDSFMGFHLPRPRGGEGRGEGDAYANSSSYALRPAEDSQPYLSTFSPICVHLCPSVVKPETEVCV